MERCTSCAPDARSSMIDVLAKKVLDLQGCKAVILMGELVPLGPDIPWPEVLIEAIQQKKVVEIEYILPNMTYRIKSFILPAGTKIL